jgi:hypothetical protein
MQGARLMPKKLLRSIGSARHPGIQVVHFTESTAYTFAHCKRVAVAVDAEMA